MAAEPKRAFCVIRRVLLMVGKILAAESPFHLSFYRLFDMKFNNDFPIAKQTLEEDK